MQPCATSTATRCACVIMASGMATRFGSNKLLADLGGRPLIAWVLDATAGIFDARVVVTRHETVRQLCEHAGVPCILHDLPSRSDTVHLGMGWLLEQTISTGISFDGVVFCQADQPLVSDSTLRRLLGDGSGPIRRAGHHDVAGAPVFFPTWTFAELMDVPEGKGGGYVVKAHPRRVELVEVDDPWELRDVDTVADLKEFRTHLGFDRG